ncbi:MAG TPA: phosphonopyruvate decarboxylase [Flavisolibacter sp.]|jgi:phosphonopyruvate decarboxylase
MSPEIFLQKLRSQGIDFFAGVPDSLLKGFISSVEQNCKHVHHITANEGAAVALAAGYHLATGKVPLVYLQNSGLGNVVNPLTSLADKEVYSIPILLVIGWRGEPGVKDEPQHSKMGKITPALLNLLQIPFIVIKKEDTEAWKMAVQEAIQLCNDHHKPAALLVEEGSFSNNELEVMPVYEMSSHEAISHFYLGLEMGDIVICTTGKIGRVFYQINSVQQKIKSHFLNVGSMGHAISIATGVAMYQKRRVFVLDGDGSLLMHMGSLALTASLNLPNLIYVVLNNGAHQSVGAQPTLGFFVDFCTIAKGCGFTSPFLIENSEIMQSWSDNLDQYDFVEIRINTYMKEPLPRPEETPKQAKENFMRDIGTLPKE